MGEDLLQPTSMLDGQATMGMVDGVVVMIFDLEEWLPGTADQLFQESTQLNPNRLAHVLIQHLGAEPSAAPRQRLGELQLELEKQHPELGPFRLAVITDSALTRGAMTAFRWVTSKQITGFSSRETMAAARWTAGPDGDAEAVHRMYLRCMQHQRPDDDQDDRG